MLRPPFYLRLPLPPLLGGSSAGYRKKRKEEEGRTEGKVVVEVGAKRWGRWRGWGAAAGVSCERGARY